MPRSAAQVRDQWFVKMEPLAKPALAAVAGGDIRIVPDRFERVYNRWLENIRVRAPQNEADLSPASLQPRSHLICSDSLFPAAVQQPRALQAAWDSAADPAQAYLLSRLSASCYGSSSRKPSAPIFTREATGALETPCATRFVFVPFAAGCWDAAGLDLQAEPDVLH